MPFAFLYLTILFLITPINVNHFVSVRISVSVISSILLFYCFVHHAIDLTDKEEEFSGYGYDGILSLI